MHTTGKIHSIETFGTVDGPGIRYIIFLQGCPLRCKYCHNRDSWNLQEGKDMSVEELLQDIKKYIPFMKSSGGGVTISGGEPTLQLEFLLHLLKELKKLDVHTCLDTSGFIHTSLMEEVLEYVDLVLMDVKHINSTKHKELVGVDNDKILAFGEYLSQKSIPIWIRHVVVPTYTDEEVDIKGLAEYILNLKSVKKVELLPYHSMGKEKWQALGLQYPLEGLPDATEEDIKRVKAIFNRYFEKYSLKIA
ncbi:MAG: pyruvate formate lyase-activating protein [Clostridiaceae bacterium]|nr:pyruvate formate lyase-activating protein [Clostridiaceae bacterium]